MASLNQAIEIAEKAHEGATDKYGAPYIEHVKRVMNMGKTDNEKIAGILHDLIEDTHWTFEDLEKEGFSKEVIDALKCVTKISENEDYESFISRVKTNPLAVKVKINDLTDNLDVKRMPEVLESDLVRLNKYLKAYKELINFLFIQTNQIIVGNKPIDSMSPKEKRLMELINGAEPKDETEKQIVKEIHENKDKGYVAWIPSDF